MSGQYGNIIGRLDPRTGQAKEYKLPTMSMPHTVQLDNQGNPWFSGNKNGTVGKFDPATGEATVFKMPDPKSDPHTSAFNKDGILFFSFQASNLIGRLNPKTGELKVVSAPNPKSQPYDVKVAADGTVWVSCNARGCLLKVDPVTMEVTEIPFPIGGSTRRFDISPDGMIWFAIRTAGHRPLQPEDRRVQGMAVAVGRQLASLRRAVAGRRLLVQQVGHAARSAGALRSRERDVPELADPVRRHLFRHPAQHARDPGRQHPDPPVGDQPHPRSDADAARCGPLSDAVPL